MGDNDPGAKVTVPTVRNERHNYVSRAEMLQLAKACQNRATRAYIRIAFYSGMRLDEIERARIVGNTFVLDDTKNGDRRVVPIHPRIRCCLGYPADTRFKMGYHWRAAKLAIGRDDLTFHDLRHSAASELINQGVDLYTVLAAARDGPLRTRKSWARALNCSFVMFYKTSLLRSKSQTHLAVFYLSCRCHDNKNSPGLISTALATSSVFA